MSIARNQNVGAAIAGPVALTIDAPIATLTLARPPVNALDSTLIDGLSEALDVLEARRDVAVAVLRSSQKVFCGGADLPTIEGWTQGPDPGASLRRYAEGLQILFGRIEASPIVTVCELSGAAMGGGLELALAADFRLAVEGAKLGLPEVTLGLVPAAGGTQRMVRLAGLDVARRLILRGEIIDAAAAKAAGLVDEVFARDAFRASTDAFVQRLASLSVPALRAAKECLRAAEPVSSRGLTLELDKIASLISGEDARQRVRAFLNKTS